MYNDDRGDRIGLIDRGDSSEDRDPLDASLRLNLSDVRHVDVRGDSVHDRRLLDDRGGSLGRRLLDNARRFLRCQGVDDSGDSLGRRLLDDGRRFLRCQGVRLGVDLVFEFKGPRRRRGHESLRFELIIKDFLRFLLDFQNSRIATLATYSFIRAPQRGRTRCGTLRWATAVLYR